ncbi:MAG: LysE family translocator [Tateyamaria sp.]|jgi:threonine/homoserine/homoserine lactone efflux protein|uniref:LysE family translocator n=1 Tax=unclassified Tateyamaria TaxID=2645127 RepID=UPI000D55A60A|nr:LysE family translocator [Tateyamaria sp. Alg231-49]
MTLDAWDIALYAGALAILFLTPGPVWVGLIARSLSGGFHAAWPLALGVVVGDVMWSLLAIFGITWVLSVYGGFLEALKWVAAIMFVVMGALVIRGADKQIDTDSRLTRPGMWAGFVAGLVVILGNPKAILFYAGMLPGFFDLTQLTALDIVIIATLSMIIPLIGNLAMALFIDRARRLMQRPEALRRMNITAGVLLICVGLVIPLT